MRLEFEMQRLELEQQLEDMRERMAREKKTRQQNVAHEQWVTEQKRNLQAIKIGKASLTLLARRSTPNARCHSEISRRSTRVLVCSRALSTVAVNAIATRRRHKRPSNGYQGSLVVVLKRRGR